MRATSIAGPSAVRRAVSCSSTFPAPRPPPPPPGDGAPLLEQLPRPDQSARAVVRLARGTCQSGDGQVRPAPLPAGSRAARRSLLAVGSPAGCSHGEQQDGGGDGEGGVERRPTAVCLAGETVTDARRWARSVRAAAPRASAEPPRS